MYYIAGKSYPVAIPPLIAAGTPAESADLLRLIGALFAYWIGGSALALHNLVAVGSHDNF